MPVQKLDESPADTMAGYCYLLFRCAGFLYPIVLVHARASLIDEQFLFLSLPYSIV